MSKPTMGAPAGQAGVSSPKELFGIIAAAVTMVIVLLLPTPEGLTPGGHKLAAIFISALVLWSTEALPMAVTVVLVIALQPLLGLRTAADAPISIGAAISNSISPIFFFVMVMYFVAFAWVKTGLASRFAYWMISIAGTNTKRIVWVFMGGSALISSVVSDVPCAAIFMGVGLGILERLKVAPGQSNFGRCIMLGIPLGALIGGVATPAGSSVNLIGLNMIKQAGVEPISFLTWMMIGVPMALVLLPIAVITMLLIYPPEIKTIGSDEDIKAARAQLGPMSGNEVKVLIIMAVMMTLWISSTWFPGSPYFDTYTVALVGATVMFLPGIRLFTWSEVTKNTGWDVLLLIMGISSLGAASNTTGLAKWLAETVLGDVQGSNMALVLLLISAFTVLIHLVMPIAPIINAVMIPPIMALGTAAGVNPMLYALPVIFTASCAMLLPLDAVPLVTYGKGYYKFFDMFKPGFIISIVWVIVMTVLMLLIGPRIGLL
ncbi:MAG TPA: DASS family sodium-coupled anion symporter [Terriglobia bacterium]|nr:DASS family sodium-coupled anion symporter [Terriglobia bacterium]